MAHLIILDKSPFSGSFVADAGYMTLSTLAGGITVSTGTADPNRYVVVGVSVCGANSANTVSGISSATLGGINLSVANIITENLAFTGCAAAALLIAQIPSGTSSTLVVNWSGSLNSGSVCHVATWRLLNANSAIPDDTAGNGATNAGVMTCSVTIQDMGMGIYFATSQPISTTGSASLTQTGDNARFNTTNGVQTCAAGGDNSNSSGSPITPSVTFQRVGASGPISAGCGASWH